MELLIALLLAGDIELNPGPQFPAQSFTSSTPSPSALLHPGTGSSTSSTSHSPSMLLPMAASAGAHLLGMWAAGYAVFPEWISAPWIGTDHLVNEPTATGLFPGVHSAHWFGGSREWSSAGVGIPNASSSNPSASTAVLGMTSAGEVTDMTNTLTTIPQSTNGTEARFGTRNPGNSASGECAALLQPSTATQTYHQRRAVKRRNPVMKKHRSTKLFQTLNQAKTLWDPKCKPSGLFGGHINIRSMTPKREQLEHLVGNSNIDFLGLTETWLTCSSPNAVINMPGYNVFRRDRVKGRGGGVLLYIKDTLKCKQFEIPNEISLECIGVTISLSSEMSLTILCIYRKPSATTDFFDQLKILLNNCDLNKELIIMGDLNINWENKKDRRNLKQIMDHFNLKQMIDKPTRITSRSSSCIDLLFTNNPERIVKTYNLITGLSDHNIILFSRKLTKARLLESHKRAYCQDYIPKNQLQNLDMTLKEADWNEILVNQNVETGCNLFISKLHEVVAPFMKRGKQGKRNVNALPWIDDKCKKMMKERDLLLKKSIKSGLTTDRQKFTSSRNKVTSRIRKAKAHFYINIIEDGKGNVKNIWKNINKLIGRQHKNSTENIEIKINGFPTQNPAIIATEMNNYFVNSVHEIAQEFTPPNRTNCPINPNHVVFKIKEISELEVLNIINSLNRSKSKDVFDVDTNFLKQFKESLLVPITHLVNLSFTQSVVPSAWKLAVVSPIFKSGDKTEMSNYRPISILPSISKIAEKWVAKQINEHLNDGHTSLHPMQFGFRNHHSTESANCILVEKIKGLLDKNVCVGAVFLDLKKAFDTVNHNVLLSKLTHFNISDETLQWFKSYLSDRKQCVSISGIRSQYLNSPSGVPQGSILGPILFSIYINDLPDVCPDINIQMYADDAVIFTHAKNPQEASQILTSAMTNIQNWVKASCLQLNAKKTVCMMFSKRPSELQQSNVFLNGVELSLVKEFKYLGLTLDPNLTFKKHIRRITHTVNFNVQNFRHIRPFMTLNAARMFLHTMIFSHIEYCITSWSLAAGTTLKPIESLFKKAIKVLDRKPNSFHHCTVLDKYGLLSFDNFIYFKIVCLIYKVLHGLAPPPLKDFIKSKTVTGMGTRATARGDCEVSHRRTTFGQTVLSVKGTHYWNRLPLKLRECPTLPTFKLHLKLWLKENQVCQHF